MRPKKLLVCYSGSPVPSLGTNKIPGLFQVCTVNWWILMAMYASHTSSNVYIIHVLLFSKYLAKDGLWFNVYDCIVSFFLVHFSFSRLSGKIPGLFQAMERHFEIPWFFQALAGSGSPGYFFRKHHICLNKNVSLFVKIFRCTDHHNTGLLFLL